MNENLKTETPESLDIQEILKKAKESVGDNTKENIDPLEVIIGNMQHLEMGIGQLSRMSIMIGRGVDIAQLTIQLLFNILIESNLISKEDLQTRFNKEVIEEYQKIDDEMRKQALAQAEEEKKRIEEAEKLDEQESAQTVANFKEMIDQKLKG